MEKSKKNYWAILRGDAGEEVIIFEGSHSACWKELITGKRFKKLTLEELGAKSIRIGRIG